MENRLLRSTTNRFIAGVCGGLGEYFDVDPTIVRLLFVLFTFLGGSGVLVYVLLWVVIPETEGALLNGDRARDVEKGIAETVGEVKHGIQRMQHESSGRGRLFFGAALVIFGLLLIAQQYVAWLSFGKIWPAVLVILGAWMLVGSFSRKGADEDEAGDTIARTRDDE